MDIKVELYSCSECVSDIEFGDANYDYCFTSDSELCIICGIELDGTGTYNINVSLKELLKNLIGRAYK